MRQLDNSRYEIEVTLPKDELGMVGRECPNQDCLGYFKVKSGTGLQGEDLTCTCPYCGHTAESTAFHTQDQIKYARSVGRKQFYDAIQKEIKSLINQTPSTTRGGLITMRMEYHSVDRPIQYYAEKSLETELTCRDCQLHYAIYGVFGHCPDCGKHNTIQILKKNLEVFSKLVDRAEEETDSDFAEILIATALEKAVGSFDAFGREACRVATPSENIRFQNIVKARERVSQLYGFDLAGVLEPYDWNMVVIYFNKRHLLAHKMGVIDEEYIRNTNDPDAILGRRVSIEPSEIREFLSFLRKMGERVTTGLF